MDDNKELRTKNEELVTDPRELLLSLVDMGSLDIEEALLACVREMSDAECKRVLSGLSLPECCDMEDTEVADETPADDEFSDVADEIVSDSEPAEDEEMPEEEPAEDEEAAESAEDDFESVKMNDAKAKLEDRIARLERLTEEAEDCDEFEDEEDDDEAELEARIRRLENSLRMESRRRFTRRFNRR